MNIKRLWTIFIIGVALVLGSCSSVSSGEGNSLHSMNTESAKSSGGAELTNGYTIENLKKAMEDYINERLWYYPETVEGKGIDTFDSFVGQTLQVEVRLYKDDKGEDKIYGHTDIGDWLVLFAEKDGYVYADGQVSRDAPSGWPGESFQAAGSFAVKVNPPHQIEYGNSTYKQEVIAAMDKRMRALCADLTSGSDAADWMNAQVYVADFHPYDDATTAWVVRSDGYVWVTGVFVQDQKGEVTGGITQGFGITNMNELEETDPSRYSFEKRVFEQKPVVQFACD